MELMVKKLAILTLMLLTGTEILSAQDTMPTDSLPSDSLPTVIPPLKVVKEVKDWSTWKPNPKRALWLALVIPGGGQIYNRKYWKLPLVYGGFLGCLYAMNWNNSQYKDYSQAFLDISDNDPNTASYNKFLHFDVQITDNNRDRYKDIFKKRRDKYRRWRDLSFFVLCGVYALSVIDAYVDAELSVFDISKDLSLRVEPTIINTHASNNPFDSSSIGLQCSVNF
ncbi:MAG: hypothetical protein J6X07_09960 [Prevotella sp.]|jgi:hypothetical protein|nr:hypothetical protein [Prevotella sp.]